MVEKTIEEEVVETERTMVVERAIEEEVMSRDEIFEMFFNIVGSHENYKVIITEKKIKQYQIKVGYDDAQINDLVLLLQSFRNEMPYSEYSKLVGEPILANRKLIAPVLKRLNELEDWEWTDCRIAARVVRHTDTYEELFELVEKIFGKIGKFLSEESYWAIRLITHINALWRLLNSKLLGELHGDEIHDKLEASFVEHQKAAIEICSYDTKLSATHLLFIGLYSSLFYAIDRSHMGIRNMAQNQQAMEIIFSLMREVAECKKYLDSGLFKDLFGDY